MTNAKTLCLNMIVKNEMANLECCLSAVVNHIDYWVIGDTGSTDGTQEFIKSFFAAHNLPGELHSFPFHNFEQARNAALNCAYASSFAYDYLLLDDADMELVVEDHKFREMLEAPCYDLLQRHSISFWNPRIVRRDAGARYRGVTHEYLAVPGGSKQLSGVWYRDHHRGSNRVDKFERDIRLLEEGLKSEPENRRYWFYLAQSYYDTGKFAKAAEIYAKRAEMGGWDEEVWYARLQEARCLRNLDDEGGFLRQALAAFNQRPQRAEPLYDLAQYYRKRGNNAASVLFSEPALSMPLPRQDALFLEDFVYTTGIKEEYSIAANYARDPARKDRGFAVCNWLALDRATRTQSRNLARWNLFFYLKSASAIMPSFQAREVGFTPPDGYHPSNPSVARLGNAIVLLLRAVNFSLTEEGAYRTPNDAPLHTRNFLLRLDPDLTIRSASEILPPANMPPPAFRKVQRFEDARLFAWHNKLWCVACVREPTPEGLCDQVLGRIEDTLPGSCQLTDWRVLRSEGPRKHEKHWMPQVLANQLQFIYLCDPTRILDENAHTVAETTPAIAAEEFRGGTQAITFDGGWLALVHEVSKRDKGRYYQHRFVWFDSENQLRRVSRPFFFVKKGVEFAAGLALHPDGKRLLISYGVGDGEAWIATVETSDVRRLLDNAELLPWNVLETTSHTLSRQYPEFGNDASNTPSKNDAAEKHAHPMGRTFDLFDTLVARRCVHPQEIFNIIQRTARIEGFADTRAAVEAEIYASGNQYTIDDIYARLAARLGISATDSERLKSIELEVEKANIFAIAQHCHEFGTNDAVVSDTYLPETFLAAIINEKCNLRPRLLFLSSHGKRNGTAWRDIEKKMRVIEHIGDHPITDKQSAEAAGIPARVTTVARRTLIEEQIADAGLVPLSNLIRESRLSTWAENAEHRRAQILQIESNFPLLFLATLHLRRLAAARRWDNVLMSGRDCYLWHQLYGRMTPLFPGLPPASYFYTSRIPRAHPSSSYLTYFNQLRTGKRNVVVDLCGTGWSLSRLIEHAPKPDTEIFLLHRIDLPHVTREYESWAPLARPIEVNAVISRAPIGADNDVLENLNRAPHGLVEDVRHVNGRFVPVYALPGYTEELGALIRIHHETFEHTCTLLATMGAEQIRPLLDLDVVPMIEAAYRRMSGDYGEFKNFSNQKRAEESIVRERLQNPRFQVATCDLLPLNAFDFG